MINIIFRSGPQAGLAYHAQADIEYSLERLINLFYSYLCFGWDWGIDYSNEDDQEEIDKWKEAENLAYFAWLSKDNCRALTVWQGPFCLVEQKGGGKNKAIEANSIIYAIQDEGEETVVICVVV